MCWTGNSQAIYIRVGAYRIQGARPRMNQKEFDAMYKALMGDRSNTPKMKYKDPDRWMDAR